MNMPLNENIEKHYATAQTKQIYCAQMWFCANNSSTVNYQSGLGRWVRFVAKVFTSPEKFASKKFFKHARWLSKRFEIRAETFARAGDESRICHSLLVSVPSVCICRRLLSEIPLAIRSEINSRKDVSVECSVREHDNVTNDNTTLQINDARFIARLDQHRFSSAQQTN